MRRGGAAEGESSRWRGLVQLLPGLGPHARSSQARLLWPTILVGVVSGLAAAVFFLSIEWITHFALGAIAGYPPTGPAAEPAPPWPRGAVGPLRPILLILVPTVGGLLCGWLVQWLAPEAEGHGTNNVIDSYHHEEGRMRPRVPLVKIVASALTIGTGGSGGREGPIAQIGAGFGSFLADVTGRTPADRRILLAAGMGGGIAAIFRAPLAGAVFAAEVLYRSAEFEAAVLIPAGVASVVSYTAFSFCFGFGALFETPTLAFKEPIELVGYFLLAVWAVVLASLYVRVFYWMTRIFGHSRLPRWVRPAVGGGLTGALALAAYFASGREPQVLSILGAGYGILQQALRPEAVPTVLVLLLVAVGKIFATGLTIGSGGSGGVFGPSMVIGGCGGGALGLLLHQYAPQIAPEPIAFVVVGAAGFFAAAAKTPFSSMIMVTELTGDFGLLTPALWVTMIAYLFSERGTIYSAQLEGRGRSPANPESYLPQVLRRATVRRLLHQGRPAKFLRADESLQSALEQLAASPYAVLPVLDPQDRLLGVVGLEEAYRAAGSGERNEEDSTDAPARRAADFLRSSVTPLCPSDKLEVAVERFIEHDVLMLPVVQDHESRKFLGMIRRRDVDRAYLRYLLRRRHDQRRPAAPRREP